MATSRSLVRLVAISRQAMVQHRALGTVVPCVGTSRMALMATLSTAAESTAETSTHTKLVTPPNVRFDRHTLAMLREEAAPVERAPVSLNIAVHKIQVSEGGDASLVPAEKAVELDPSVWNVPLRKDVVHRVVIWQQKNNRTTMYKTKDRAEVTGGGKKPWKQKGTGRARHGSTRSPLWVGGGVAHGPLHRDWSVKLPKAIRDFGLRVALSAKVTDGRLFVVEDLKLPGVGTGMMADLVRQCAPSETNAPYNPVSFIDTENPSKELKLSVLNLQRVRALPAEAANVKDIVASHSLVITVGALNKLTERLRT